ncbi:MAG TPA: hypothetical protein ACFYEC_01490 [Candidatus Brocadiaceae bacterium]
MNPFDESGNVVLPNDERVGFTQVVPSSPDKDKPTFGETAKANFRQFNDVYRGLSWLADKTSNPYREEEVGYNPIKSGLLEQVPDEYHRNILETTSLSEGQQVVKKINKELEDRDIRERSGWMSNLTTILGATLFSPTTLVPLTQTAKYANVTKGAFEAASYSAKVLGPAFALQNAVLVGTKETGTVQEWATNTVLDTFVATGIGGALGAFASKGAAKELSTAKAFFKAAEEDIDIRYALNEKGEIDKMIAMPRDSSVGAQQVHDVQALLDSGHVSFKDNKFVRETLGRAQPIVGMLTNRYKTVQAFADSMFSHVNPVANGNIHAIRDPSAENFVRLWNATFTNLQLMTKQHYHDFIGYTGPGKAINATLGEWKGKWMSSKEFSEEVGRSIRRGGVSEIPEAGQAAEKWIKEQYDPMWAELKKRRPDLEDSDYTNIAHYLNRIYHKGKIQERPDEFLKDLTEFIDRGNKQIEAYQIPIRGLEEDIENLKKVIKQQKGDNKDLYKKQLTEKEKALAEQHKKIAEDIKSKKIGEELLDKADKTKLRAALTPEQTVQRARMTLDTILQENEEQLVGRIFDDITGGGESVLKARTLLWNDSEAEKWLVDDINVLGGLYMDQLAKRIHADDVFLKYGIDAREGMKGMVGLLKKEHDQFKASILEKPFSAERTKELNKLDKDFKKAQALMEDSYKIFMGNYVDRTTKLARTSSAIKQLTAATLLGNMPILQLTEFFAPMYRFMFGEYIQDGLMTALKRCKYIAAERLKEWGGKNVDVIRGAFADAGLGMNMANGSRMQALFGYGTQYQPKTLVERYVNNLANASMHVNLSTIISDFQETAVAFASQSKTIRTLKRFAEGRTLTTEEIARLDVLRLNPNKWGNRILDQVKKYGEDIDDAFISNFHKWDDFDASQIFRIGLEKETRSLITKPNMMDLPFGFRDPLISLMTQFLSFTMSATLNFGLPSLTHGDKQKYIGIMLMMASGAMIDPLRRLAKGEEIDFTPEQLIQGAMTNSGVFGWPFEALQRINSAIDMPLLRPFQADRFRRKGAAGLLGGPALGLGDSISSILSALANGEMNENDARKATRLLVPFSGTWFLRQPVDGVLKSMDMPSDRGEARARKGAY